MARAETAAHARTVKTNLAVCVFIQTRTSGSWCPANLQKSREWKRRDQRLRTRFQCWCLRPLASPHRKLADSIRTFQLYRCEIWLQEDLRQLQKLSVAVRQQLEMCFNPHIWSQLTKWTTDLLGKLILVELVTRFLELYGTQGFIA
jgi:hypothetical protein